MAEDMPCPPSQKGRDIGAPTANAIDNHIREVASLRHLSEGEKAEDSHGTVLAIVKFPQQDKLALACDGKPWKDFQLRMRYDKLMSLDSRKIQDMFTPRAQERFRRRLGFQHGLPPGIEYVLDFTPPSEGLELADLTAALWLPRVVKIWFLAGQYLPDPILANGFGLPTRPLADKAVGATLALGHDDVCMNLGCLSDYSEWQVKPDVPGIIEDSPSKPSHIPHWRKVEDYCPIRHRVAIVRVLRAINGEDLLLNSAVRLWTVAQVAISLEVPRVVVDPVAQWLVAPPNTKFIEICPEKAFQLAYKLKIPSVLITAFKILVSELAVDYASSKPVTRPPRMTWAQRRRDDYGDYPFDPVEYASRAFAERMGQTIEMLQSDDAISFLPGRSPEWDKLRAYSAAIGVLPHDAPLREAYDHLTTALVSAFRQWVDKALNPDSIYQPNDRRSDLLEAQRRHYIPGADRKPLLSLYWVLNPTQKALTPFFWEHLSWPPSRSDFLTSPIHSGKSLESHATAFNNLLTRFLSSSTTDPAHPALSAAVEHAAAARGLLKNQVLRDHHHDSHLFDIHRFYEDLCRDVGQLCNTHLVSASSDVAGSEADTIQLFLSDHLLLSLNERELSYLPIWANGLDDGSGGVFQEAIPPAEMGPSEPGPGYHTGYTVGTGTEMDTATEGRDGVLSTVGLTQDGRIIEGADDGAASTIFAPSDLGVGGLRLGSERTAEWVSATAAATPSPAGRSVDVQRSGAGTSTDAGFGPSRSGATASGSFTAGDVEMEGTYVDARYAQPAAHQAQGQAIEMYVDEVAGADATPGSVGGFSDEELELDLDDGSSTLDGFEEVDAEETR
ncbi:hypothetical protein L209DRAFT_677279 [Thermothelomyces heterothallicus CBS 203.75]